ncbi:RNA polymerase sigma factor [Actinacidiphila glaucinigra]|uniref:RNA polymerase sigma factor n=1 Tax=Actinacidiphila glaucinigra TaxID=235986 RepID=UPI0035D78E84
MTTATATVAPVSSTDLIIAAYQAHHQGLLAFVYDHLDVTDHRHGEDIASEVWVQILSNADRVDHRVMDLAWLQIIARGVIRRRTSPRSLEVRFTDQLPTATPSTEHQVLAHLDTPPAAAAQHATTLPIAA